MGGSALLWQKFLLDVHQNEIIASAFYIFVAVLPVGIPLRFVARVLERLPPTWLSRETTTGMVTFFAWTLCWFAIYVEPSLNGTALYSTVTAVLVGPLLKKLMTRVDDAADRTTMP